MDTQSVIITKSGVQKIGRQVSPELPTVKDANVNTRDRLNDILQTEKHYLLSYQTAMDEIINDDLKRVMMENRNSLQNIQTRMFEELFNLGEYQAELALSQQIADTVEVFTNYRAQLPNI